MSTLTCTRSRSRLQSTRVNNTRQHGSAGLIHIDDRDHHRIHNHSLELINAPAPSRCLRSADTLPSIRTHAGLRDHSKHSPTSCFCSIGSWCTCSVGSFVCQLLLLVSCSVSSTLSTLVLTDVCVWVFVCVLD